MRKLLTTLAAAATCATALPSAATAQYYGTYGSSQVGRNTSGYYADGTYRDRYGVLRDRYGNRVAETAYSANVNASGFYVDSRGTLRDRRGRVVTNARAERNGWYRDNRGIWVYGSDYAASGTYRDRNGVLRDRYGNRVTEQTAYANGNVWVGEDGRTYCRRSDGTVGTIVGGVAGALLGNAIGGTVGAVIGGGAGALGGRAIQRSQSDCR
jgi:hypothetical protein